MKITPLDIRRKEFRRSVRGYSDEEVDIFLDEVADEFERLFQENMELQDRAQRLDEQIAGHAQVRDALEKTLVAAQLQSEEIRANAHKESELILRDAQLKARGIVNDSYSETQKAQQTLVQVKRLEEEFRFKFRSLLEGYLKLLDDAAIASAETAGAQALDHEVQAAGSGPVPTAEPGPSTPAPAPHAVPPGPQAPIATAVAPAVVPEARADVPAAPAVAPEARADVPAAPAVAPEAPVFVQARPVAPIVEEEIPTEETEAPASAVRPVAESYIAEQIERAVAGAADDVTAESLAKRPVPPPSEPVSDDSLRGFFFGRQIDDVDDTFPGEDGTNKQKGRDFEW